MGGACPPFNQARGALSLLPPLSCPPALFARSLTFLHWTISNVYPPPYSYFLSTHRILDIHREIDIFEAEVLDPFILVIPAVLRSRDIQKGLI